jgi:alkanesulfonate monooxygenase SsuD/methylene tetrahydromethanopterin reductase-like flavin-dependent oxidoreductase (luciferase family)
VTLTFGLVLDFATPTRTLDVQLDRYRDLLAVADRYGFHSVTMGEGHSSRPQWGHTPAPFLVLATLAPTTRMRLGSGVTLLAAWHPLKLAYDAAVLDQLSGGRLILGVGLGPPDLARRYGVEAERIGDYVDDTLAALRALWAGENGYRGKYLSVEGSIGVYPLQPGGPPVWVGGSVQRSVERAAQWGDGYIGSTSQSFDHIVRQIERYRAALSARGKDPGAAIVASNRLTLVAETAAEARQLAEQHVGEVLRFYAARGAQMPRDPGITSKTPAELFHELDESRCLVGSPEQVAATARRYADAGVTHILARVCPHDIPIEDATRTVELLGKWVLPQFR